MKDRVFIAGLPYKTSKGYAFNLVRDNKTRVYIFDAIDQAAYLSSLANLLYETGIDFSDLS